MTMTNNKIVNGGGEYIAPLCTLADIIAEGVLCSSLDGFDKEFEYNPWGETNE